jgi:hypothetical protein
MAADRPPRIPNAPGLTWKPRKNGWEARWQARTDIIARGYEPKSRALWMGPAPNESQRGWIGDQCRHLQSLMLNWGRDLPTAPALYDGSLASLIACYRDDKDSSYRKLRYRTRQNYDTLLKRITRDHGLERLPEINARMVLRWHDEWSRDGHIAMGHAMVGMLRTLLSFGATILELPDCERLCVVLHRQRFTMAPPRKERMTAEQAIAVRAAAHKAFLHSIALAQAFQFELMLRQKDVIGEWVPQSEPGTTDVFAGNDKWLRGLRWSEIDDALVLRHTTSKKQKDIEVDLRLAPMVVEELERLEEIPREGPVIVSEATGIPWTNYEFRRQWRKVARLAGVPDHVFNMDSRAGGISEATDAGADLEHVRHAATHSNIGMTQGEAIKIGFTNNLQRRLESLQCSHHFPLFLLGSIPAAQSEERIIHGRFSHLRLTGEWFRPTAEVTDFIDGFEARGELIPGERMENFEGRVKGRTR